MWLDTAPPGGLHIHRIEVLCGGPVFPRGGLINRLGVSFLVYYSAKKMAIVTSHAYD